MNDIIFALHCVPRFLCLTTIATSLAQAERVRFKLKPDVGICSKDIESKTIILKRMTIDKCDVSRWSQKQIKRLVNDQTKFTCCLLFNVSFSTFVKKSGS